MESVEWVSLVERPHIHSNMAAVMKKTLTMLKAYNPYNTNVTPPASPSHERREDPAPSSSTNRVSCKEQFFVIQLTLYGGAIPHLTVCSDGVGGARQYLHPAWWFLVFIPQKTGILWYFTPKNLCPSLNTTWLNTNLTINQSVCECTVYNAALLTHYTLIFFYTLSNIVSNNNIWV